MTKFELLGVCSARKCEQLVTQADAEDRIFAKQFTDHVNRVRYVFRVPRAVGQLNSVRVQATNLFCCHIVWHNNDVAAAFVKFAQESRFSHHNRQARYALLSRAVVDIALRRSHGTWSRSSATVVAPIISCSSSTCFDACCKNSLHCAVVTESAVNMRVSMSLIPTMPYSLSRLIYVYCARQLLGIGS